MIFAILFSLLEILTYQIALHELLPIAPFRYDTTLKRIILNIPYNNKKTWVNYLLEILERTDKT